MDCYAWLKDSDEFPSLTSEKGWDDCRLDDDDDKGGLLDAGDDDDGWQIVSPHKTTFADIVKRVARTNGPFQKRQANTFPAEPKNKTRKPFTQAYCRNNNNDDEDAIIEPEPYVLRKSRSRRRYQGDAWIFQHRVTVLTRLGYGSTIQGHDFFKNYEPDDPTPLSIAPVDRLAFIHCWRYICKEDPEPEVDQLRKDSVKFLTALTSDCR